MNRRETIIEAGRTERYYWLDLWRYRELFAFLTWRDILVRYKQTVLGVAWAVLRPLFTVLIFSLVFGRLARLPSEGVPYALLVAAAILPWQFFSSAFSDASSSVIGNAAMISKVYFPRLIIPASSVIVGLVDFAISATIVVGLMVWYGITPGWRILSLPLFIGLILATSLGAGLWFAALNVAYRDFRHVVPFVAQLGLYISPVGFSSAIIPEQWRMLYAVNPMVGAIDGFRWALLGTSQPLYWPGIWMACVISFLLLATGVAFFRRTEKGFADII